MRRFPLSQRLSTVFVVLLLTCCSVLTWLQTRFNERHGQEVIQRLSAGLAAHIASSAALMEPKGLNERAVSDLFSKLMDVNPSVEVYVLDDQGNVVADAAPDGHVKRRKVDLQPINALLHGAALPILADDPRSEDARKVFSVAPLMLGGRQVGYVYVVLLGESVDAVSLRVAGETATRRTLWVASLVALFGVAAGVLAFRLITRPLRELTSEVEQFDADGLSTVEMPPTIDESPLAPRDEIATLRQAFSRMTRRILAQWQELTKQDQQRRELVANVSHDLRTPLTSLHGFLETLRIKAGSLSDEDRQRYLDLALAQSRMVGRLAQELFELARLEYGAVKLNMEQFALQDLVQDVLQKFELTAESRQLQLACDVPPDLPVIRADIGMIERVFTNLLDNAVRHTPAQGRVDVQLRHRNEQIEVQISDTGPGIPEAIRKDLFFRSPGHSGWRDNSGGLGLLIVQRMLSLHGCDIQLVQRVERGTVWCFQLKLATAD
jgi:signal transduction histidine kinase